ncbi:helix-turn-helix domain-containing protein [Paenibacillus doosanensis]|uniref:AraC family transcriptional regulator n=1 Tax=Paenibacillus doosanensis TaxID=1229154 RepID=UPI0021809527|nr:helix-turn-helix domain-containing protein [Paenibacillus doosanensis]MCS7459648.1 helix-turn-helix domain-containing protein [Paenibacillus doosanensis]
MTLNLHTLFRPVQGNGRIAFQRYVELPPSPALRPYVSCYWASEPASAEAGSNATIRAGNADTAETAPKDRVLPDGCADVLFECDTAEGCGSVRFCGILERPFPISYDEAKPVRKFGIRFLPGGAYPFIRDHLSGFTNRHVALGCIWRPAAAAEWGERVMREPSLTGKVRVAEQYLLALLHRTSPAPDAALSNLLHRMFTSKGTIAIAQLAEAEVIGVRRMNRLFERHIGLSPKKFAGIVRFQSMLRTIEARSAADGLSLAFDHGFFDQSHMIRDFQRYYGASPLTAVQEFGGVSDFYNPPFG